MSKLVLISDIHANLPAFEAVLDDLNSIQYDSIICLGDIVGYGPHPTECISLIKELKIQCVKGNHDAGVSGELTERHFRNPNRSLIKQTREMLTDKDLKWLRNMPYTLTSDENEWFAVHASPNNPTRWEYLESAIKIRGLLKNVDYKFCLIGHTHIPAFVSQKFGEKSIQDNGKYLINPGSIGQSRDGDYRASYCILDTQQNTLDFKRVEYNLEKVVNDLEMLGFSRKDAEHLMRVRT